jgi:methyl-accepting chemotaxis protein
MLVPVLFAAAALIVWRLRAAQAVLPLLNTLALTMASISMIAGGGGMIEYHFSIFMVLAILVYYENVRLLLVSTVLFAAQYAIGFAFFSRACIRHGGLCVLNGHDSYPVRCTV